MASKKGKRIAVEMGMLAVLLTLQASSVLYPVASVALVAFAFLVGRFGQSLCDTKREKGEASR